MHALFSACSLRFSHLLSAPFLVALETQIFMNNPRNWWSMDPSSSCEISLTVRWLWDLSSWLSNSDSTVSTFSSVRALRLPLPERLSAVPNFTSSLFFVKPLFRNFVINCQTLQSLHSCRLLIKILSSLLNSVNVAAFALHSVKIRDIFGVRFERRKVDKKANLHKNWNMQTIVETFEYFCQISSKSMFIYLSYTASKLGRFPDTVY